MAHPSSLIPENMQPTLDETHNLRRCVRDLVALSTLTAIWGNADSLTIGRSLAEVLLRILSVDFVFVRLRGRSGEPPVEAVRTRRRTESAERAHEIGQALGPWLTLDNTDAPPAIRSPVGDGMVRLAVFPIGRTDDYGLLAAGGERPDFPTDTERLLLGVAVNQAAGLLQRREAEEELCKQSEWLRVTLASIGDAVITTDEEGRVTSLNQVAESLTGWSQDEARGQPLKVVFRSVNEQSCQPVQDPVAKVLQKGRVVGLGNHTVLIARDGTARPIDDSAAPIRRADGETMGVVLIFRDITERKNLERRRSARLAIIQVLAQAAALKEAAPRILQAVCEGLGWDMGAFWIVDAEAHVLRCQDLWHTASIEAKDFMECCGQCTFDPGIGLPGRVWQSGRPAWILDVAEDNNFPRAAIAVKEGLHGAFGAPIHSGAKVLGVIEFFSREIREPDPDLLEMMATLGGQIGQVIDRQRAEEHLRQSEAQFRQLADALPQIVWTARPDGYLDYYNERWYEFTGFPRGQCGDPSWMPILHPDDVQRCVNTYYGCIRSGSPYQIEYRFKDRKTGGYRWFLGRAYPVRDKQGRILRWFGTCTDIDDTKRAEETTRFLADASATLAELTDFESTLQRVASLAVPRFADWCTVDMQQPDGSVRRLAVTHTDPAKVRLAHELFDRYPPLPTDPHGVMAVLRSGEPEWSPGISDSWLVSLAQDQEHLRRLRNLGLKSYICVPLRSRAKLIGALTFATAESGRVYDADDLRAAEDLAARAAIAIENASLLAALREADRRKDEFLAMLAHELRNPLAPIRNAMQVFRAKGSPLPELQWARDVIDRQLRQMTRLVDDLLDVSRITRGKIELRKERVELAPIVSSAVEASRPLLEKWGHQLTVTLPPEAIFLEADQTRLIQVLLNLLNNAAKYTDPGGRIWLTAERKDEQIILRVKDTGIGIPQEMLPRIFQIFTQVDRSLERSQGGLGIGLTLVQRLVELHGGTVTASSGGPGKGSEFIVRLPVVTELRDRQAAEITCDGEKTAAPPTWRILVVDDNRDSADSLAMILRIMGNEVHTAYDGLEAVRTAAAFQPDVVLLDIGLPKLNGYEAGRRIREQQGSGLLLVALTGWGQEEDRRRSKEAGFDCHMTKPVELESLQKLLAALA